MIGDFQTVIRETKLGNSKLDFLVDQTYVEVKTPLTTLHVEMGDHIVIKNAEFNSFERFIKHMGELSGSLSINERAILIVCLVYENNGFKVGNLGNTAVMLCKPFKIPSKMELKSGKLIYKLIPMQLA